MDCRGYWMTAQAALQQVRDERLARLDDPRLPVPSEPEISDDLIRETIEANQLRIARERGHDLTIFSPRAPARGTTSPTRPRRSGRASATASSTGLPHCSRTTSPAPPCPRRVAGEPLGSDQLLDRLLPPGQDRDVDPACTRRTPRTGLGSSGARHRRVCCACKARSGRSADFPGCRFSRELPRLVLQG
jgi:hypothetical protein